MDKKQQPSQGPVKKESSLFLWLFIAFNVAMALLVIYIVFFK